MNDADDEVIKALRKRFMDAARENFFKVRDLMRQIETTGVKPFQGGSSGGFKIIHTDNFGGDYPDEKFVEGLPFLEKDALQRIADAINEETGEFPPRYYRVVPADYELQPGFEP